MKLVNAAIMLLSLCLASLTTYLHLYVGPVASLWTIYIFCAFLLFFSTRDELESLVVGPLKGRMRETLRRADETLELLRQIATPLAQGTFRLIRANHFPLGGMPSSEISELEENLSKLLRQLGVAPESIAQIRQPLDTVYISSIVTRIRERLAPFHDKAVAAAEEDIRRSVRTHGQDSAEASASQSRRDAIASEWRLFAAVKYDESAHATLQTLMQKNSLFLPEDGSALHSAIAHDMDELSRRCKVAAQET